MKTVCKFLNSLAKNVCKLDDHGIGATGFPRFWWSGILKCSRVVSLIERNEVSME